MFTGLTWTLLMFAASFEGDCQFVGHGDEIQGIPGLGPETLLYEASARVALPLNPAQLVGQSNEQVYRGLMRDVEALVRDYPNFRAITPLVRQAHGHRADPKSPLSALAFARELGLSCSPGQSPEPSGACPQNNYLLPQRRLRELLANFVDNYAVTFGQLKGCRADAHAWLTAIARDSAVDAPLTTDAELIDALLDSDGERLRESLRAHVPRGCAPDRGYDYLYLSYTVGPGTEPSWYLLAYDFSAGGPTGDVPPNYSRIVPFEALAGPSRYLRGTYSATYHPATANAGPYLDLEGRYRVDLALWPENIAKLYHKQFMIDFVRTVSEHITAADAKP